MSKISLIIVDDHKIFRDGLKLLLSRFPNVELIGEASDGAEFLDLLKEKSLTLFSWTSTCQKSMVWKLPNWHCNVILI